MAMNLFSSTGAPTRTKNLVEFKAGKMNLKGKMVQPDKRKGLVYIYQSEDSLMHFCWKDRTNGIVEDDLMIFPDDIETKKIVQCTTGRVYLMKFKSSAKKFFFWMQETDTEKDEKLWKKLTEYLNNPPAPGQSTGSSLSQASGAGGAGASERSTSAATAAGLANAFNSEFGNLGGNDLQSLLGSMNEQQLQMFLSGLLPASPSGSSNRSSASNVSSNQTSRVQSTVSGSRTEPVSSTSNGATPSSNGAAVTAPSSNGTTNGATLTESKPAADVLSTPANKTATKEVTPATPTTNGSNGTTAVAANGASSNGSQKIQLTDLQSILGNLNEGSAQQRSDLDLSDIGFLDVMAPILANKSVQEKLIQYLPESDILPKNEQELKSTLTTPQFKKAMSSFSAALQSGQLGPVMRQFDLPEQVTVAASQGNMEAFARAMETYAKTKKEKKTAPPAEEDDNKMDTK